MFDPIWLRWIKAEGRPLCPDRCNHQLYRAVSLAELWEQDGPYPVAEPISPRRREELIQ